MAGCRSDSAGISPAWGRTIFPREVCTFARWRYCRWASVRLTHTGLRRPKSGLPAASGTGRTWLRITHFESHTLLAPDCAPALVQPEVESLRFLLATIALFST